MRHYKEYEEQTREGVWIGSTNSTGKLVSYDKRKKWFMLYKNCLLNIDSIKYFIHQNEKKLLQVLSGTVSL